MISLDEFREMFINEDIKAVAANDSRYETEAFIDTAVEVLRDAYALVSEMSPCYWEETNGTKKYRSMHVDAAYLDSASNTLNLLYADYNADEMENITNEFLKNKSQQLVSYFENSLKGYFVGAEQSNEAVQMAYEINNNLDGIYQVHLFIVSTNKLSRAVKKLKCDDVVYNGRVYKVILDVLDIEGIYKSRLATFKKDDIIINCSDFHCAGLPCIKADIGTDQYESYLAIVPGQFLSDIYKEYSSALLESNVRSFLKLNGGVNKGIRATILNDKSKFFTYNNGISTTAKNVSFERDAIGNLMITSFKDLQIINGGQTTATLAATSIKDKADLSGVYVQMKLTIVRDENPELVRNIAKYANSQNKVKTADLNSSHPFYVKIEELSRKTYAPKAAGAIVQQLWFFERARGQYDQPMMQMSQKQREEYKRVRPKEKRFSLVDLAKYNNAADCLPHYVSWGGEVNASHFHNIMEKQWEKDKSVFNEFYYKELIGKKIMFSHIENLVSDQPWYQERKAYRPQIVAYTFSKLVYEVNSAGKSINYRQIWDRQEVPESFDKDLARIGKIVFDCIYATSGNIGTYCKQESCWKVIRSKPYEITKVLEKVLADPEDIKIQQQQSRRTQKFEDHVFGEVEIFKKGAAYWKSLQERAMQQKVLSSACAKGLEIIIGYCELKYLELSKKQLAAAQEAINHLKENGIE